MTQRYVHLAPENLKQAIRLIELNEGYHISGAETGENTESTNASA